MRLFLFTIWSLISFQALAQLPGQVKVTTYYDAANTFIREEYFLKDSISGILHGPYRQYYQSGRLAATLQYEEGKAMGPAAYYYENGNLKMQGELKSGKDEGYWDYYYENGKKRQEGQLIAGAKEGEWIFYYENGQIKRKGSFSKDIRTGIWNYFYEDGSLKAQALFNNGSGNYKEFYTSGNLKMEGNNNQGKSEGPWVFYYENGEIEAKGSFVDGMKSGIWKYYHPNGNLAGEGAYAKGVKTGAWTYYYPDGTVSSEGAETDGTRDGYWKFYYESGETKGEISYDDGSGSYQEFFPDGRLKIEGQIVKEKREGEWRFYNDNGTLEGVADYNRDTALYKGYYADGTLKMSGQMVGNRKIDEWNLYNPDGSLAGKYKPIYEEEDPIYITTETIKSTNKEPNYDKPAYRFKNRRWRYFDSRINEYRGYIFSIDPSLLLIGQLTFSLEYYFQERMGYELQSTFYRDPFFSSSSDIANNDIFSDGVGFKFRQRFYSNDGDFGMFYFGHEIGYAILSHESNVEDSVLRQVTNPLKMDESRIQYGVFIGNRWMENAGESGLTIDIYIGAGIGWRNHSENFSSEPAAESIFSDISTQRNYFPIVFGVQIGFAGPRRRNAGF